MDVNWTDRGIHFIIYTRIKSWCRTPETNTTLYVNYVSTSEINNYVFQKVLYVLPLREVFKVGVEILKVGLTPCSPGIELSSR